MHIDFILLLFHAREKLRKKCVIASTDTMLSFIKYNVYIAKHVFVASRVNKNVPVKIIEKLFENCLSSFLFNKNIFQYLSHTARRFFLHFLYPANGFYIDISM